jgi:DHA1 family multidrug resistance protein-like MFS transporter
MQKVEKNLPILYTPITLLLIIIVGLSFLGLGFVMPLRALYGRQVGATSVEIGAMSFSFLLAGFLATPFIGWLTDRVSYRSILAVGLLLHMGVVLTYILVENPLSLIALRAVEGIAAAAVLPPARALMNSTAPRTRQGEALGLISAAQTFGILIGPAVGAFLASQTGYAPSFLIAGIPLGIAAGVTFFLLPPICSQSPEQSQKHEIELEQGQQREERASLFTRPLTLAYILQFIFYIANGVAVAIWSLYMIDRGASLPVVGLSYTTFALPIVLIAPFAGRLSDRYGRYWIMQLGLLCGGIVFCLYSLPLTPFWIVIISVLEGSAIALSRAALDGYVADIMPGDKKGKVQANYNATGTAGALLGSATAGILYLHSTGLPFLAEGLLYFATILVLLLPGLSGMFARKALQIEI